MPIRNVDATIQIQTALMAERLSNVAAIARSASTCSAEGNAAGAVDIALDIEQLLYEVTTLLNAMCLLNRIARD